MLPCSNISSVRDEVWKALADPRRRELLDCLKDNPLTTGDLCDAIPDLDRCTVMKHLEVLVRAGLVVVERRGRTRLNYLNPAPLHEIVERWVSGHTAQMAQAGRRLKALSENTEDEQ